VSQPDLSLWGRSNSTQPQNEVKSFGCLQSSRDFTKSRFPSNHFKLRGLHSSRNSSCRNYFRFRMSLTKYFCRLPLSGDLRVNFGHLTVRPFTWGEFGCFGGIIRICINPDLSDANHWRPWSRIARIRNRTDPSTFACLSIPIKDSSWIFAAFTKFPSFRKVHSRVAEFFQCVPRNDRAEENSPDSVVWRSSHKGIDRC
jgi:hypothetical protein